MTHIARPAAAARLSNCANIVRQLDRDRYLCALLAPPGWRDALFALEAFDLELARVPDRVSEPLLGAIRFQWWREALDDILAGRPRRHDVSHALAGAVEAHGLDVDLLRRAIDARDAHLAREEPSDLCDIEALARDGRGSVMAVALRLAGASPESALELGAAAAVGCELAGLLMALPECTEQGRTGLPRDVLLRHGLSSGAAFGSDAEERAAGAARELVGLAERHIERVVLAANALPRPVRAILLPVTLARIDIGRLRRCRYRVLSPKARHRGASRQLALIVRHLRGAV